MVDKTQRVEIWHRPTCSNSRGALEILLEAGIEPVIVDYVNNPPDKTRLKKAIKDAGLRVRDAIRSKEPEYQAQGLGDPALSDDALLQAMVDTPKLINRPFVFTAKGTRLCRPPETVLEIL
ncbi:arsenate reductase (glutaredoxin) [Thermomonas sp.]|uniref:arsenate reductase (glutaredoxin) n=1 Tax=Thermomonas sp. TaxID=1971895 RepID=UPI0026178437|nr:arsenate reductase (glutaredoxin) [Thermomonas sp.]MCO5054161.1 arsenate reductase (glutaredoxin) [Thermomonas sp.]